MTNRPIRHGFTFVELIASIAILAICIVPASQYLTESMTLRRRLEWDSVLVRCAIQTIEQQMALINGAFTTTLETGTLASQGLPEIAYQIVRTDAVAGGGIPDLLMSITVSLWLDENGNAIHDAGERMVELHTLMAQSI